MTRACVTRTVNGTGQKSWAAYNRAKGFAGGGRGFMIVIQNAREDALL